jgi:hypothetical protein
MINQQTVNPIQLIQMIKNGKNPQQLMMSFLENQIKGTPMGDNILALAKNNNSSAIEEIARNISSQRGIDFDKEFIAFKKMLGL